MDEPPGNAQNLRLDPEGFWVAERSGILSYPEDGNSICYSLEDDSFWFRHRNDVIVGLLRHFPPPGPLFDVGGGNGYVAVGIERAGMPTVLVEPGRAGAENARRRGLREVICATIDAAGFASESLPAVGLFDVLEHIQDDVGFLASMHRLMRPGGRIYLTVPAYQTLWSREDDSAGHRRRYTAGSLARVLRLAGFEVEYQTYFFWFLPLPVLFLRAIPCRLGLRGEPSARSAQREHSASGGIFGWLLGRALSWERSRVARCRPIPIEGSCFAVARRLDRTRFICIRSH